MNSATDKRRKENTMHKLMTAVAGMATALALAAPAASAQAPALGGERLTESDPAVTSCAVGSSGGSFAYVASGTATGAYPGTFTETGTITVGPEEGPTFRQRVTSVSIQFAIDSPAGQVTGTKQFVPTGDPNVNTAFGRCTDDWGTLGGGVTIFQDDLRYSATIVTPDGGTCTQSGPASLSLVDNSPVIADSFDQRLFNDLGAPAPVCESGEPEPPAEPTSKEDCRDGGWARFGFRNQGECIAFVVHRDRGE